MLQNYSFNFVPVQLFAFIVFVSFLLPYASFFPLRTENLFCAFQLSGNSKFLEIFIFKSFMQVKCREIKNLLMGSQG